MRHHHHLFKCLLASNPADFAIQSNSGTHHPNDQIFFFLGIHVRTLSCFFRRIFIVRSPLMVSTQPASAKGSPGRSSSGVTESGDQTLVKEHALYSKDPVHRSVDIDDALADPRDWHMPSSGFRVSPRSFGL